MLTSLSNYKLNETKIFSFLKLKDLVEVLRKKKKNNNIVPLLEWNLLRNEGQTTLENILRRAGLRLGKEECSTASGPNSNSQNLCAHPNSKTQVQGQESHRGWLCMLSYANYSVPGGRVHP